MTIPPLQTTLTRRNNNNNRNHLYITKLIAMLTIFKVHKNIKMNRQVTLAKIILHSKIQTPLHDNQILI